MKQIIENKYLKSFKFSSSIDVLNLLDNQNINKRLILEDFYGEHFYCYISYHSLTREIQYAISFSSDESEDNLNFLFWNDGLAIDTGKYVYLINKSLQIQKLYEITTPLIGLYLIDNDKMLILEEAYMRVVNNNGEIIKSELFDLILDFQIKDNQLFIQTDEENKIIQL